MADYGSAGLLNKEEEELNMSFTRNDDDSIPNEVAALLNFDGNNGDKERNGGGSNQWLCLDETIARLPFELDEESFVLGCRIGASCVLASLFTLVFEPNKGWPEAQWIMITAGLVLWTTSLDTATTVKKVLERVVGTAIGAFLGIVAGAISCLIFSPGSTGQAFILGAEIGILNFLIPYIASTAGYRGTYAATMVILNYMMLVLSFYDYDTTKGFHRGLYRTVNIIIGCILSGSTAIFIWPLSTKVLLGKKIAKQMKTAGASARLTLSAAHGTFLGLVKPHSFEEVILLRREDPSVDEAYGVYMKSVEDWKNCKVLFPLLKYDPAHLSTSEAAQAKFRQHMCSRLAQTFRVQTILISIDMIVRCGDFCDLLLTPESLEVVKDVGLRMEQVLDLSINLEERRRSVKVLMGIDLSRIRQQMASIRGNMDNEDSDVVSKVRSFARISFRGGVLPLVSVAGQDQLLLFFLLVEQLILRTIALHYYCLLYNKDEK